MSNVTTDKTPRTIATTRFGDVEVTAEHFIEFRDGMIGFPHLKQYVLVESTSMPLLMWLQSTENPAVAFPVMEPWFFRKDYAPNLGEPERLCIKLEPNERSKMFVVLTIPPEMTRMTVNMKAPVVINLDQGRAVQMVLADKNFEVRVPAHESFSKAIASFTLSQPTERDIPAVATEGDNWTAVNVKKGATTEKLLSMDA
ncbi:MAG: flagellar assembly protein FliW [Bdellovibrionales bacterium]|nr:flagellar assembly protein FliW [Bdellovibrionales bacterium]